jgi:diguanylate cyclase (GGDEF)-like protein
MGKSALAQRLLPDIHILLVEDNQSDAFTVGALLEESDAASYLMHHVRTQSEALLALSAQSFDVCLLDLSLPDTDGFSALACLLEKKPDMPVLILTGSSDKTLGKHAVGRGAQDYLLKDEMRMDTLARSIDYAMERKRAEKELFKRANFDSLTGLSNRGMFEGRLGMALARAKRMGSGVALLFIDLDHFKRVNDMHGHGAGDEVLRCVAGRLKSMLRVYDTAARMGGDEFAVLLEGVLSARDAAAIAQKLINSLTPSISYQGRSLDICVSVGIAFAEDVIATETLLKHADIAMYHAKKQTGNAYRFYSGEMQNYTDARLKLEGELRSAISAEELELYYQPYVSLDARSILGVETLLRWSHPAHGLLAPVEFLAIAEDTGLISGIGVWMFSRLLRDFALWDMLSLPPMQIAINISANQLDSPDLLGWLAPLAREEFLGTHRLVAEIEGSVITQLNETRVQTLIKLKAMGIALHLDHFGCHPISLQTLGALPFSLIKLDMSLIHKMDSQMSGNKLIRLAIEMAHHLGIKAGAVGVETPWQIHALKTHQCDVMQGYMIARPMTVHQLADWLKKSEPEQATQQ